MGEDTAHLAMGEGKEFDAIRQLLAIWGGQAIGIGDDAAVLEVPAGERVVVSVDASVENVHFRREWITAEEIGARAAAAALSDLAAMAASPRGMLVALSVPESWRGDLDAIARGIGHVATSAGCPIVGGNMTASSALVLTLTVVGSAVAPLRREGAREGDIIFVTGQLGGPAAALAAWVAGGVPDVAHRARFAAPVPRLREAQWLADHGVHAAIDLSDGLLADAAHLALASVVTITIDAGRVPCMAGITSAQALESGEEYELLVAAPPDARIDVTNFAQQFGISLTAIGTVISRTGVPVVLWGEGAIRTSGYDHFQ